MRSLLKHANPEDAVFGAVLGAVLGASIGFALTGILSAVIGSVVGALAGAVTGAFARVIGTPFQFQRCCGIHSSGGPEMMAGSGSRTMLVAPLLCLAALLACTIPGDTSAPGTTKPADVVTESRRIAAGTMTADQCREGNDEGRRLNDLAEHVHDTAVSEYLRENVVAYGRTSQPQDDLRALMLLDDNTAYELCVTVPERCLRAELLRTESPADRDILLSSKGNYAYERALACLERAGDAYAAREPEPDIRLADPAELDATYRERVLPHLVGNMMPVALLTESNFFGADDEGLHQAAVTAWHECHDSLAGTPLDPSELVRRVSMDQIAALECAEAFHEQIWGENDSPRSSHQRR